MKLLRVLSLVLVLLLLAGCASPAQPPEEPTTQTQTEPPPALAYGEANGIRWREVNLRIDTELRDWLEELLDQSDNQAELILSDNLLEDIPEADPSEFGWQFLSPDACYLFVKIMHEHQSWNVQALRVFDLQSNALIAELEASFNWNRIAFRDNHTLILHQVSWYGQSQGSFGVSGFSAIEITLP